MISLLIWLVLGFVAGYIAKLIMPGADGGGLVLTILLGIVGAVVGGMIGPDDATVGDAFYALVDGSGAVTMQARLALRGSLVPLATLNLILTAAAVLYFEL